MAHLGIDKIASLLFVQFTPANANRGWVLRKATKNQTRPESFHDFERSKNQPTKDPFSYKHSTA